MRRSRAIVDRFGSPLAVLACMALPVAAVPASGSEHGAGFHLLSTRTLQVRHGAMTIDQAIEMAERRFHARVVRAGVEESAGQRTYVLRLISEQGRVWTVRVDAQSGTIL